MIDSGLCKIPVLVLLHAPREETTSALSPLEYRVMYKVLMYKYKALTGLVPHYISDLVQPYAPARPLRSASQLLLKVPKIRTATYGSR